MVTAAGVAHTNRLPVLLLSGDYYVTRLPDPVLQQVEHFGDPTISVNDAFKPVTRYWDRITRPEQIIAVAAAGARRACSTPPTAARPSSACARTCRPRRSTIPSAFFEPRGPPHPAAAARRASSSAQAAALLRTAKKPLIIAGGGVRYSGGRGARSPRSPTRHRIPVVETIAGRTVLLHDHPMNAGPIGVHRLELGQRARGRGRRGAGGRHAAAGLHHRLLDRCSPIDARFIGLNAARFDATQAPALPVVGDAQAGLAELGAALRGWQAPASLARAGAASSMPSGTRYVDQRSGPTNAELPTYAHVVGAVNRAGRPDAIWR